MLDICWPLPATQKQVHSLQVSAELEMSVHTDNLKSEGRVVPLIIQVTYDSVASQRDGACGSTVLHNVGTKSPKNPSTHKDSTPEETCGRTIGLLSAQTSACARCGCDPLSCSASLTCVSNSAAIGWPYKATVCMVQNARNEHRPPMYIRKMR